MGKMWTKIPHFILFLPLHIPSLICVLAILPGTSLLSAPQHLPHLQTSRKLGRETDMVQSTKYMLHKHEGLSSNPQCTLHISVTTMSHCPSLILCPLLDRKRERSPGHHLLGQGHVHVSCMSTAQHLERQGRQGREVSQLCPQSDSN